MPWTWLRGLFLFPLRFKSDLWFGQESWNAKKLIWTFPILTKKNRLLSVLEGILLSYVQIGFMVWSGIAEYEEKKTKGVNSILSLLTYYICLKAAYALKTIWKTISPKIPITRSPFSVAPRCRENGSAVIVILRGGNPPP